MFCARPRRTEWFFKSAPESAALEPNGTRGLNAREKLSPVMTEARKGNPCLHAGRMISSVRKVNVRQELADRVGFEPTVSVNPRRFSRPLP